MGWRSSRHQHTTAPTVSSRTAFNYDATTLRLYTRSKIESIFKTFAPQLDSKQYIASAAIFPMRVNNYVLENLIDWAVVPNDPIFKLVFPQPEMLSADHLQTMLAILSRPESSRVQVRNTAEQIRGTLNAHPARQKEENVPKMDGKPVSGLQHKYRETVLFFPMEGQFCHSYCTYCFRWAQFTSVGSTQQFKSSDTQLLPDYISRYPQVSDILLTGGDPIVMSAAVLAKYIRPLLDSSKTAHLKTIRIGTKSLGYWPMRYTSDADAKDLLKLFDDVHKAGKQVSIQAHVSHPRELQTRVAREAVRLIRMTGAQIRSQAPLIRHVNDSADLWRDMWREQVALGIVPYYMFVERDTGPRDYFSVPFSEAYEIFTKAYQQVSGLCRTVRGPSMSYSAGKVAVLGIEEMYGQRVFVLKFLQARVPSWTSRVFFAAFDARATWFDELKPAFGDDQFFFEKEYEELGGKSHEGSSGQVRFREGLASRG
ncbi:hypothetical protein CC86DRAFT_298394 [Ophiobolus disseminans]|uniref:Lysine 2,3-aminomutase n=1 Tax=Ophiobolus disseminans TaxID=1469910 RepID=A0A6A6ZTD4_9PLEO|nr:hypothetical protein CC86DRAFT_298394 [Ophiobolus disseminans]